MRWLPAVTFFGVCAAFAGAQETPGLLPAPSRDRSPSRPTGLAAPANSQQAEVADATRRAEGALRRDILATPITPDVSIAQFLKDTDATAQFKKTLMDIEQVGGPRWIDPHTCEVQLQIDGADVAKAVAQIAAQHPAQVTVPAETLQQATSNWEHRTFTATGTNLRMPEELPPAWQAVSEDDRRHTLVAACLAAANHVLKDLNAVRLTGGHALGEVLERTGSGVVVRNWLSRRPISDIDFRDDLTIRVTLAASADEIFDKVRSTLEGTKAVGLPLAEPEWGRVREQVQRLGAAPAVGLAKAQPAVAGAVALPNRPPAWVNEVMTADAIADPAGAGGQLKTRIAAYDAGVKRLRTQVDGLPLDAGMTVADAVKKDPRLEHAVDRAMTRTGISKVVFLADGSVQVTVDLRLFDLWTALTAPE